MSWEFINNEGETIEVEANTFDEASFILFNEWEENPSDWSFVSSYGRP